MTSRFRRVEIVDLQAKLDLRGWSQFLAWTKHAVQHSGECLICRDPVWPGAPMPELLVVIYTLGDDKHALIAAVCADCGERSDLQEAIAEVIDITPLTEGHA